MFRIALLLNGRYVDSREFSDYTHFLQSLRMYADQGYTAVGGGVWHEPQTEEVLQ